MIRFPIVGTNQPNIAKELIDYNHNERYSNNNVTVENLYPQGVIPSVVASDDEDMEGVDSGTESCDSKDSGNKKNGERKRPGRKKGQGNGLSCFFLCVIHLRILCRSQRSW